MFIKFFRRDVYPQISTLDIDMHSHLIPSIDDGSKSIEDSLEILHSMSRLGYKKIITTPHIMMDKYPNSTEIILDGLNRLREAIEADGLDISIDVGAEYYMDENFNTLLDRDDILTIGDDNYVLFETSYITKPIYFKDTIYKMQVKGYKPILAHPERYRYISNPKEEFLRLKDLGILFQLDINSLGGHYGKLAKRYAKIMVQMGIVDFLGSDVHYNKQTSFLEDIFGTKEYREIFIKNKILNDKL